MEVKLIATTDAMWEGKPAGSLASPEQVCNHAAKTCTSEDAGTMAGTWYVEDEPVPVWNDLDMKPLKAAIASGHESVLENAVYTFEIKGVSRALLAQLSRHRLISLAVQSQRYVNMEKFEYVIPESIRKCDWVGHSLDPIHLTPKTYDMTDEYNAIIEDLKNAYKRFIKAGIPPEDARLILPSACTTNIVLTANARELRHIFALRCCERAQWEIRELANKMLKICKEVSPTIFDDAGPSCVRDGFCREQKSCGRAPKLEKVLEVMYEIDGEASIRDEQRTAERECHR